MKPNLSQSERLRDLEVAWLNWREGQAIPNELDALPEFRRFLHDRGLVETRLDHCILALLKDEGTC